MLLALLTLGIAGCSTAPKVNWNSRVGTYTYDDAIKELGPPDKSAQLTDKTTIADWLLDRGGPRASYQSGYGYWLLPIDAPPAPDYYLRLTFDKDNKLTAWKKLFK